MLECDTVVKKWGNSLGILLPRKMIKQNKISSKDKVHVIVTKISKKNVAKKLWGVLAGWKTPTEELEKQIDKEFDVAV